MSHILITGMSGTGKSTVIGHLNELGYLAVDTDEPGWCIPIDNTRDSHEREWIWDEERMSTLLRDHAGGHLFVSGCRENQGRFYDRFDHIVLFTAPLEVMLRRVATRTGNPYGRTQTERDSIVEDVLLVEPLLKQSSDTVIDTSTMTPTAIVQILIDLL